MTRILTVLSFLLATAAPAQARVKVVTTIQAFKVITEEIGGDLVEATALVGDAVDPHHVDPKPSYAVTLNKADLLVHVGLDLEAAWLPPLLSQARNPGIQAGQTGNLDASTGISVLDATGDASRAKGDIHPLGNPHYWLTPTNGLAVARVITDRLKQLDEKHAADYDKSYAAFEKRLADREKDWAELAKPLSGVKVVTYHKSWSYLTGWLGMSEAGYIEPKPGVPPDPKHLAQLVRDAKKGGAKLVIVEAFYPRNTAQRVADLGGMTLVPLYSDASGPVKTFADLLEYQITTLVTALAK